MTNSLDALPIFERYPFDGKTRVPVFEVACITGDVVPHTDPSYNRELVAYVVGTSCDRRRLFYSKDALRESDGLFAEHSPESRGDIDISQIRAYDVLLTQAELSNRNPRTRTF